MAWKTLFCAHSISEGIILEKINLNELNCFITFYFGQDYDLIDDSDEIEPKIDAFIADTHYALRHGLIDDIDLFLAECDDLEKDFHDRYQHDFDPALWNTTPADFLKLVRDKVRQSLQDQ